MDTSISQRASSSEFRPQSSRPSSSAGSATRGPTVEVAHEALIREWPTLRQWLAEDREGLILHRQLTDDTAAWQHLERDPGALYRGARLQQALTWADANPNLLSLGEQAFLDASRQAQADELEREVEILDHFVPAGRVLRRDGEKRHGLRHRVADAHRDARLPRRLQLSQHPQSL